MSIKKDSEQHKITDEEIAAATAKIRAWTETPEAAEAIRASTEKYRKIAAVRKARRIDPDDFYTPTGSSHTLLTQS